MWRSLILGLLLLTIVAGPSACGSSESTGLVVQGEGCASQVRWTAPVGGDGADRVSGVASVGGGAAVIVGVFQNVLPMGIGGTMLTSAGQEDVAVARFDQDGNVEWARRVGGPGQDIATGVAALPDGAVIVVGHFEESAAFGPGEPGGQVLHSAGAQDVFLARIDSDGTLVWARRAGGSGSDRALAVAALPDGSSVVTGSFAGSAIFGDGESRQEKLVATSGSELFVARYDPDGRLAWARQTTGSLQAVGTAVAILPDGSIVVAGEAAKESTDTIRVLFVARYTADGTPLWLRRSAGEGAACAESVAAFADGSALAVGAFRGTVTLGANEAGETALAAAGERDILLARYASDGTLLWARAAGGIGDDVAAGVTTLAGNAALVVGRFSGSASFGGDRQASTLFSAGEGDVFLALYDSQGRLGWLRQAGGTGDDAAVAVAALPLGSALVGGVFSGTAVFGAKEAREQRLTAAGLTDGFLLRVGP